MNRYKLHKEQIDGLSKYIERDDYPENKAKEIWIDDSDPNCVLAFSLCRNVDLGGFYCGYVRVHTVINKRHFDKLDEEIEAHGGITFRHRDGDSFVVGFDCGHWGDKDDKRLKDLKWLKQHCEDMGKSTLQVISLLKEKSKKR